MNEIDLKTRQGNKTKEKDDSPTQNLLKTWKAFKFALPIIISVLLVVSFLKASIPVNLYHNLFTGNGLIDSFIGATVGSVSIGNPILSYIIGGELSKDGVSLFVITAFLISWVTVGIVQLPAEIIFFGKRFSVMRNLASYFSAIIIGILAVLIMAII